MTVTFAGDRLELSLPDTDERLARIIEQNDPLPADTWWAQ
jgi:hypothetical protein